MKKINTKEFLKHLEEKWKGQNCPLCGSGSWNVSEIVFEIRKFTEVGQVIGSGPVVPIVPVTCENCGNTVMVNALISHAIEQPTTKGEENEK